MTQAINKTALLMTALLVCAPFLAMAAAERAPVDGGLSLLIAGGVSYAAKKIAKSKRKK